MLGPKAHTEPEADHLANDRRVVAFGGYFWLEAKFGALRQTKIADISRTCKHDKTAVFHLLDRYGAARSTVCAAFVGSAAFSCDMLEDGGENPKTAKYGRPTEALDAVEAKKLQKK